MRRESLFHLDWHMLVMLFSVFPCLLFGLMILPIKATETLTLENIAEAMVQNMGGAWQTNSLVVSYLYGGATNAYVMFNLSSIPDNSRIDSAKFEIKAETFAYDCINWVSIYTTLSNWTESGISWSNKPTTEFYLGSRNIVLLNEWYSWTDPLLVNAVSKAKQQGENLSIVLQSTYQTEIGCYVNFYPSRSSDAPKLVITYTLDNASAVQNQPPYDVYLFIAIAIITVALFAVVYYAKQRTKIGRDKNRQQSIGAISDLARAIDAYGFDFISCLSC